MFEYEIQTYKNFMIETYFSSSLDNDQQRSIINIKDIFLQSIFKIFFIPTKL